MLYLGKTERNTFDFCLPDFSTPFAAAIRFYTEHAPLSVVGNTHTLLLKNCLVKLDNKHCVNNVHVILMVLCLIRVLFA